MPSTRDDRAGGPGEDAGLARFLEATPALVVVLDRDGRILDLNRAGAELLGVDPGAVRGTDWFAFVPPEVADEIRGVLRALMAGDRQTFASYENEVVTARGIRRTLLWSNVLLGDDPGAPTGCIASGIDVTDQRRAVAALRQAVERAEASEARLRILAERTRDVIWTFDLAEGRFTYVSPSITALRGLTPQEAMAEPLEASLMPESLARVAGVLAKIGTPGEEDPHLGVYDQPCKDGSIKHVEITATFQRDGGGRPVAVVGISRDATERVQAERALRHSETLYRSLFNAAPVGVLLTDQGGRILAFNDRAAAQLGYGRDEFARLALWQIDEEDDEAQVRRRTALALRDGRVEFDTHHRARDGSLREVHVRVVRVDLGEAPALLSIWDDITEPRRLERELRLRLAERDEREAWLQASQRVARLGHYVFDVSDDRWTSSATLDEIFGIGPDYQRTATTWLGLVHPDDQVDMSGYLQELLATGTRFDRIYRVGRAEDPPRWVHGLGDLARDAGGRPLRLIGTIQDITARRLAEQAQEAMAEQLRQAQKLESIGRLAGGVAHDFNNILVVVLGCAEALRRSVDEGRPPDPEDVEELQEAARRARDLTSQLLAFARRQVVAPVVLDLNGEVRRAERMLQRILGEDVRLTLRLEPDLWPTTFDPGQLQQVLMNLAVNSRDAMPGGGQLTISTANVGAAEPPEAGWRGAPAADGPQVRLLVEDSGQGIPEELWPRVFEPFLTTKPTGRGTGLGLATVYGIVQQAGGTVRFRSRPGRGTAFEILLARAAGPAPRAAAIRAAPGPGTRAGERILLVEDDELVRATASRALRQAGYDVTVASGGAEVLDLISRGAGAPQLLLSDVVMPGMNGRQVAEAARASWPGLRVLFMSGYAQDIIVHHGVVDPGLDLLEKPFTSQGLLARVRAALDR
jgi:PAS domain S-box-containing protein